MCSLEPNHAVMVAAQLASITHKDDGSNTPTRLTITLVDKLRLEDQMRKV